MKSTRDMTIKFIDVAIKVTDSVKYLGAHLDTGTTMANSVITKVIHSEQIHQLDYRDSLRRFRYH